MSMEDLLNIEVTSVSKHKERIQATASAIQVITHDDIVNSGATSVPEALRLVPNLQVAQVNSSQWAISARGFNNVLANKLLVLIDGRVVYTPMYAGVFWDVQNLVLEDVDRIEVISGPGGTLWGANAVNGVINIITKSAAETKGLYVDATAGSELRSMGTIRYGGTISNSVSYRVFGSAFKRGNTIFSDSVESQDDWQMAYGGLRVDWKASAKSDVEFISNFYDGRPDPDSNNPVIANGANALARWNHTINDHSQFQLQAFFDRTWRDFRNGFAQELSTYDVEGQHQFTIGERNSIIYGMGMRIMDHDVRNLELFAFRPADKILQLYNVFLQDEIMMMEKKLKLTLGVKTEYNTYTQYQFQPNVRLSWMPSVKQTLWSAVSRSVRNPARIDRDFYLDLAPDLPFITGGNFQSEELWAYEIGWRMQPKENVSFSLSTFYNRYDNIRSVEPGPEPFNIPITFANGVKGFTYGAELSFIYQATHSWRLRGGYTFLNKNLEVKEDSQDMNNASAESNDPRHQVVLQSVVRQSDKLTIGTVMRYVGELSSPMVSAYIGLDIELVFIANKNINISLTGQNLLQDHHTEFIPSSPEAKDIQRGVYGKIAFRIQ